jgi:hypothetical protein
VDLITSNQGEPRNMQVKRKHILFFLLLAINITLALKVNDINNFASATPSSYPANLLKANVLWEKTYGGTGNDRAFYTTTTENGYVVVGFSTSIEQGKTEAWVIRLDDNGTAFWNQTYLEGASSEFRYVLDLTDGFLFVGNTFSFSRDWDGYIVRTDSDGKILWNFTVGGEKVDRFFSASEISDGFMLVGLTASFGNGNFDVWVVKINEKGNIVWNKTYGWSMDDAERSITATENNFMVAGYTNSIGYGDYDFLVLQIDAVGNMLWNRTYGGTQSDKAYAIAPAQEGYVVVGDTQSKGEGDSDAWVIKIDLSGNLVWEKTVGGKGFDQPTCVTASAHDGFLVGGFTFSFGNGERDFWLFKVDDSGNVLWSSTVGRSGFEEAYAVLETAENEFVMVGWTNSIGAGNYDYYIVKVSVEKESSLSPASMFLPLAVGTVGILLSVLFLLIKRRNKKRMRG